MSATVRGERGEGRGRAAAAGRHRTRPPPTHHPAPPPQVWRAKCKPLDEEVAIKLLDLESVNCSLDEISREAATMRAQAHPNLLPLHCSFVHDQVGERRRGGGVSSTGGTRPGKSERPRPSPLSARVS